MKKVIIYRRWNYNTEKMELTNDDTQYELIQFLYDNMKNKIIAVLQTKEGTFSECPIEYIKEVTEQ